MHRTKKTKEKRVNLRKCGEGRAEGEYHPEIPTVIFNIRISWGNYCLKGMTVFKNEGAVGGVRED